MIVGKKTATLLQAIHDIASEKQHVQHDTLEGRLVAIIKELTEKDRLDILGEWNIRVSDIRSKFNDGRPHDKLVSPQWLGVKLKAMSVRNHHIHGLSHIILTTQEYQTLLQQYGYVERVEQLSTHYRPDNNQTNQHDSHVVESGREVTQPVVKRSTFTSPEEMDVYLQTMRQLRAEGGRSQVEMEQLSHKAVQEWRQQHDLPF